MSRDRRNVIVTEDWPSRLDEAMEEKIRRGEILRDLLRQERLAPQPPPLQNWS